MARQKRHAAVKSSTAEVEPAAGLGTVRWVFTSGLPNNTNWGLSTTKTGTPTYTFAKSALPYDMYLNNSLSDVTNYYIAYQKVKNGPYFWATVPFTLNKSLPPTARNVAVTATYNAATQNFAQALSNLIVNAV